MNQSTFETTQIIRQISNHAQSVFKDISENLLTHESLLNTLTLTERQELAKQLPLFANSNMGVDISTTLSQSPFTDPVLLQKWYHHHKLTEEKLRLLHSNDWLLKNDCEKELFTLTRKTMNIESPLLAKLCLEDIIFIRPEINLALVMLTSKLQTTIHNQQMSPFDIEKVILAFVPSLITKLLLLSRGVIKYLAEKLSLVQSDKDSYRLKVFNQFPVLPLQLSRIIDHWILYVAEFAQHLSNDYQDIQRVFFNGKTVGKLYSIEGEVGDTHNQGRFSFTCNFSCGKKLVYKPRSLALDNQFYYLLNYLSENSELPKFYQPIFLLRKEYGWMEYIDMQPCDTEKQVVDYYYRSGCLLSILYLLGAEDIHYKNVIARQDNPVIIDLETLFHQRDDSVSAPCVNPLNHTVLKTHFIPQYEMATPAQELAAIVSTSDINSHIVRSSLPMLLHQSVPVNQYIEVLISGFESSFTALIKLKDQLPTQLNKFLGMDARYVARPTRIYSQLCLTVCQPYFQQSGLLSGFVYDKLWLDVKKRPYLTCLIEFEKEALLQGDIPLLGHIIGTKNLSIEKTIIANDYFAHDSFSIVTEKLKHLSMKDCAAQIKIIKRSLMLGQNNKQSIIRHKLRLNHDETAFDWLKQSQIIARNIINQASIGENSVFWPVYKINHNDLLCLDSTNYQLSDGVLGLLFYLAYFNNISPDVVDSNLLKKTSNDVFMSLLNESFEEDGSGAFEGLGGVVYVISHLFSLWHDDRLLAFGQCFIDKLLKLVSQDTVFDVQAGSAGAILSLLSYYDVTAEARALSAAQAFGDHLVQSFITDKERCGWKNSNSKGAILTGFSHGSSGIVYALVRLYQITSNETYRDIASTVIAFEQTTYCAEIANWLDFRFESPEEQKQQAMSAWCNGAMGIGYSRFMMLGLVDEMFDSLIKPDITRAADNVRKNSRLTDQGLCHGNFGNQEFLHQLLLSQSSTSITNEDIRLEQFTDLINHFLSDLNDNGLYRKQEHFESLGLMNGLSGIGYQLLKFAFPERLPSILMLQPPAK